MLRTTHSTLRIHFDPSRTPADRLALTKHLHYSQPSSRSVAVSAHAKNFNNKKQGVRKKKKHKLKEKKWTRIKIKT